MENDRVLIRALKVPCILGVYEWERKRPRPVLIDLEFPPGGPTAGGSPVPAIDYARVAEEVRAHVGQSSCRLMEELAEEIASLCLARFPMGWIKVRLDKPGAIPDAETVVVEILRSRRP